MAKRAHARNFPYSRFLGGIPDDRPRYFCPGPEGPARQRPASPQVNPKREDLSQFMAIFRIGN
jgi:hypothetical protein